MRIEMLTLQTGDLNALHAFYGLLLELPVTQDAKNQSLTVSIGSSQLVFQYTEGFIGRYHFAVNIPNHRLMAARACLEARGLSLLADSAGEMIFTFASWNAHALYFYDAAGNIVELIARHNLVNSLSELTTQPFSPEECLHISEIGLPTGSVPELAASLQNAGLRIAAYREHSPIFMPLGDEHGLFILVSEGREWHPMTNIAAEALPVQVVIRDDAGGRFVLQGVPYRVTA